MLMPDVELRLLPENKTEPTIRPTQLIFHSIVGSAEGAYGMFLNSSNLESTFIVKKSGRIIQIMDTTRQADANFHANVRAGSVETEDNGHPDTDPWTDAQLEALLQIAQFYHENHNLPLRQCPTWDAAGYGYHSLFPGEWTNVPGKTCPGTIRIKQYREILLPRIAKGIWTLKEVDVPLTDQEKADIIDGVFTKVQKYIDSKLVNTLYRQILFERTGEPNSVFNALTMPELFKQEPPPV